jgi:hypothetical protein
MTDAPNTRTEAERRAEAEEHEHLVEELEEKRATEDPITAREAFELEAEEEGLSEEAGTVGDEMP